MPVRCAMSYDERRQAGRPKNYSSPGESFIHLLAPSSRHTHTPDAAHLPHWAAQMETADYAAGVQVRRLAPPRRPNAFTVVALRHHPQQPAAEDALLLCMDTPAVARVTLSEKDKAQHVQLTDDGLGAQSSKARAAGWLTSRAPDGSQRLHPPGVPHRAVHARRRHRCLVL